MKIYHSVIYRLPHNPLTLTPWYRRSRRGWPTPCRHHPRWSWSSCSRGPPGVSEPVERYQILCSSSGVDHQGYLHPCPDLLIEGVSWVRKGCRSRPTAKRSNLKWFKTQIPGTPKLFLHKWRWSTKPCHCHLHRVIFSQLLKTPGSWSSVADHPKTDVEEGVGEVHYLLPE